MRASISLELVSLSQVVILDWCKWGSCLTLQWSSLVHSFPDVVKQILCRYILAVTYGTARFKLKERTRVQLHEHRNIRYVLASALEINDV